MYDEVARRGQQINRDQPPLEITDFLDRLQSAGQRIVPDSLCWLPHPTKPGRMVPAVMTEEAAAPQALLSLSKGARPHMRKG